MTRPDISERTPEPVLSAVQIQIGFDVPMLAIRSCTGTAQALVARVKMVWQTV